ncbi:hypothetical protein EII38_04460 [Streptococcus minor]|uniref:Lipoprotein n=1 Tax=Streptococcus minor TaxID=229549 RepID=A0A3P1VGH1_9STRE|nr:hypothetical protein [Streptococcus minor]RRD31483.1 hypothetical protein EII38_04460 [Streptococcus minor]
MKKKLFGLLMLVFSVFALVACSSKSELDGKYYVIEEDRNPFLKLTIVEGKGTVESEGTRNIVVNEELMTFEVSGFSNPTRTYTYLEGVLESDLGSGGKYYKQGTKAFEEAMEKYGYTEADLEE